MMDRPYWWPSVEHAIELLGLKVTPAQFIAAFRIEGPALLSFSGGRTSGLMLWCVLVAHGGTLPDDVHVCFANTGKEREETLRFVHECGTRWGVHITWLEWRRRKRGDPWENCFSVVGHNSASRNGEPFAALIAQRGFLPNAVTRFCTQELKVRTMQNYMRSLGYSKYCNVVGLRADEQRRVKKAMKRNATGKDKMTAVLPLNAAGVAKGCVMWFWLGDNLDPKRLLFPLPQGFDLGLEDHEGNCDGCFLKAYGKLCRIEADRPGTLAWWSRQEVAVTATARKSGATFVTEYSMADVQRAVAAQPQFPWATIDTSEREHDAECGAWCGG